MPLYAYACKSCDKQFDEVHKVDDRAKPTEAPCECGGEIYICIGRVTSIDRTGQLDNRKVPGDFKDVVKNIFKSHNQEYAG